MNTEQILAELSASLGMPRLQLDANGACGLRMDDGIQVDLQFIDSEELLCLSAPIGMAQMARKTQLMSSMLMANLFLGENGKPVLALEPGTGRVALSHVMSASHATGAEVATVVRQFAAACRQMRDNFLQDGFITT